MKKTLILIASLLIAAAAFAQQVEKLPIDPAIRTGKLENGLTYYIRHNDAQPDRFSVYLSTHIGSNWETPAEDGLSHFQEHMCFNGTKNFPGKGIISYIESLGGSFGGNINAATGFEYTIYQLLDIPANRQSTVDSCILIMHDYSHFCNDAPEEIDAERGVIIEEKRTRDQVGWRNMIKMRQYTLQGTPLVNCTLIGSEEQLSTFAPETLQNYYHRWYRPDNQAISISGDIDVDATEAALAKIFADIPAVENPVPRPEFIIPDNEEPIFGLITDPEQATNSIAAMWKFPAFPQQYRNTVYELFNDNIKGLWSSIMNERLSAIASKADAPFMNPYFYFSDICETCNVAAVEALAKEGNELTAWQAAYTEIARAQRYGFTAAEVERAKTKLLADAEAAMNSTDTRKNSRLAIEMAFQFLSGSYMLDPKDEYEFLAQAFAPQINADALNQNVMNTPLEKRNLVLLQYGTEKEGSSFPTAAEYIGVIDLVLASDIEAPAEEAIAESLMDASKLKGCKVVSEAVEGDGFTVLKLKNGVKLTFKPTDVEKNSVRMQYFKKGGMSLLPTEDLPSVEENLVYLWDRNRGLAEFSGTDLKKVLTGKKASCSLTIDETSSGFYASSTTNDIETALQLIYLSIVTPRFDADEFNQGYEMLKAIIPGQMQNSDYLKNLIWSKTFKGNDPRLNLLDTDLVEKISFDTFVKDYKFLFNGADGANVVIAGDFDLDTVKALAVKYFGSLPKGKKSKGVIAENVPVLIDGSLEVKEPVKSTSSAVSVYESYKVNEDYSFYEKFVFNAISYILDMKYVETMREQEGGTYGASAYLSAMREPRQYNSIQIAFDTNADACDKLIALARKGLEELATDGPTDIEFNKTRDFFQASFKTSQTRLSYFFSSARIYAEFGENSREETEAALAKICPEDIKAVAAKILNTENHMLLTIYPSAE